MKCPHCNKKLKVAEHVVDNVETYRSPALAATLCCGKPIIARLRTMVVFSVAQTDRTEDDWGNSFEETLFVTNDVEDVV